MSGNALERFVPDLSERVEVFDLAAAGAMLEQQGLRIRREDIFGASPWYAKFRPDDWAELMRLFLEADQAWVDRDMVKLRASLESFWAAWGEMITAFTEECQRGDRQLALM